MVEEKTVSQVDVLALSVLALSSRFDGRLIAALKAYQLFLSVLALSSRFDGLQVSPAMQQGV